jgi:4-hydroxybenzoate polyprenyltransferase
MFVEAFHAFRYLNLFTAAYAIFAFLTTLSREIIKDIQDREGDARNGCRTIPVRYGERTASIIALLVNLITLAGIIGFQLWLTKNNFGTLAISLIVPQLILVIASILVLRAKAADNFRFAGLWMKASMALGLITMIFIYIR